MGNLSKNGAVKVFYVYKDKGGTMHAVHSASAAARYAKDGQYATVTLPAAESFTDFEERKILEAFSKLECIGGGDIIR